jgi:hypothetical protein
VAAEEVVLEKLQLMIAEHELLLLVHNGRVLLLESSDWVPLEQQKNKEASFSTSLS